jgi:putative transposase
MAGPQPRAITVSAPQQAVLERLLRQHSCPQALALRVRIVLGAATGIQNEPLAAQLSCSPLTVRKWRGRWAAAEACLAAAEAADPATLATTVAASLADAPRPGTPDTFTAEQIVQIVNLAWTPRELADEAKRQGIVTSISPTTIGRFLGRGRSASAFEPLLAQRQDQDQ